MLAGGALLAVPVAGPGPLPTATESADAFCAPVIQFERVAHRKKLRRHGRTKIRKWFTIERRTTCNPLPPGDPPPGTTPRNLKVKADEFTYMLSRPNVGTGNVTIELDNVGEDPHNLNLQLNGAGPVHNISDVDPGSRMTRTVALTPGSWRMWCSLVDHDARGMNATLVVDP
jgi:hypothetical protein